MAPVKLLEYIGTYYRYSSTSVPIRYKVPAYLKVKCYLGDGSQALPLGSQTRPGQARVPYIYLLPT